MKKILAEDNQLAAQLAELLQRQETVASGVQVHGDGAAAQGERAVAAGKGGIAVGGDVHGNVTMGGK